MFSTFNTHTHTHTRALGPISSTYVPLDSGTYTHRETHATKIDNYYSDTLCARFVAQKREKGREKNVRNED